MDFDTFIANVLHPARDLMGESDGILAQLQEFERKGELPGGFWNVGYATPEYIATPLTILIGNNASTALIRFALDHGGSPSYLLDLIGVEQLQGRVRGTIAPPGFAALTEEVLSLVMEYGFDPARPVDIVHPPLDGGNMYDILMFTVKEHSRGSRQAAGFEPEKIRKMVYHLYDMGIRPQLPWVETLGDDEDDDGVHWDDDLEAYVDDDGDEVEDYERPEPQYRTTYPAAELKLPIEITINNDKGWYILFPH